MISICSLVSRLADSWFRTNHKYPSELDYSAPFRPPPCPALSSSRNTYVVRVSPCDPCTPDSCFYLGFDKPSAIQQRAIKPAIQGRDLIAQSQSGTGKTAVFGISILQTLDTTSNETQARRDVVTGHYHRRRHYHRHRHRHRHYYHRHHHSAPPPVLRSMFPSLLWPPPSSSPSLPSLFASFHLSGLRVLCFSPILLCYVFCCNCALYRCVLLVACAVANNYQWSMINQIPV